MSVNKLTKSIKNAIVQLLYVSLTKKDVDAELFLKNFLELDEEANQLAKNIFESIIYKKNELDKIINENYTGNFQNLNYTERAVIYLAVYELFFLKSPSKKVIAEALKLSDRFCDDKFYKKLNAFLDLVSKKVV